MTEPDDKPRRRRFPVLFAAVAGFAAVNAAAWFTMRRRQPVTDELTRERLQPPRPQ